MANRKATFAKRQRETDLKDRAKQKEDRRSQKRGEVRENKGPEIAWDQAVHAVTTSDDATGGLPSLGTANQGRDEDGDGEAEAVDALASTGATAAATVAAAPAAATVAAAPKPPVPAPGPVVKPASSPGPAAPRRVG